MDVQLEPAVRERAQSRCEYCQLPESYSQLPFVFDHVIARQHRGSTTLENLALCCGFCNSHKGPNIAGIDDRTHSIVRLFHPRQDIWTEHFAWNGARIIGLTSIGHVTAHVLALNHPTQLAIRLALMQEGVRFAPQ